MAHVYLMLGTHKGAFFLTSEESRENWTIKGPFHKGLPVEYVSGTDPHGPEILASVTNPFYGPQILKTSDFGKTWAAMGNVPRFAEGRGHTVEKIWVLQQSHRADRLFAGIDPATLFVSEDGGNSWDELHRLTDHPTRSKWFPGGGGLCLHSIVEDRTNPQRLWVAISAAGVFYTEDGGNSWEPRNTGIRAEFLPNQFPEVGQCVHKLVGHPTDANRLFLQNHGGVYRTGNGGLTWEAIESGLPAVFGFPILVHPHEPETLFVIPLQSSEERYVPNGQFRVFRSRDGGTNWKPTSQGLPQRAAWLNVLRQAFTADALDPCGLYVGTSTGHVFLSLDNGETWQIIADHLPQIYSVRVCRA